MIREATIDDAEGIAKVHINAWQTTYEGILDSHFSLSLEESKKRWEKTLQEENQFILVAEEEGSIIGFSSGGPDHSENAAYDAELYAIYLLDSVRGKGVGQQLFSNLTSRLSDEGFHSMITWVAEQNPYLPFYQKMGGKRLPLERKGQIGDRTITITAFGWSEL